jgi:hypothetical protein
MLFCKPLCSPARDSITGSVSLGTICPAVGKLSGVDAALGSANFGLVVEAGADTPKLASSIKFKLGKGEGLGS